MANPFCHIELSTDDLSNAKKFYRRVFQWKLADEKMGPGMTYTMIDVGKGTGGGMMKKPMPEAPTAWLPYVEVEDVKKTLAKATKAGAQIVLDYKEIPGTGAIGIFTDPTGAALGIWEPKRKPAKKAAAKGRATKKKR
jgi:predicted enzyme related to lactoylglutathione lyase